VVTSTIGVVVVVEVVVVTGIVVVIIVVVVRHKDESETTVPSEQTYSLRFTKPGVRMITANNINTTNTNVNKNVIFIFQIYFSVLNNLRNHLISILQ